MIALCLVFALEVRLQEDPFGDLDRKPPQAPTAEAGKGFFEDNFAWKAELYSLFAVSDEERPGAEIYSRQSVGAEVLKKFSTATATVAAFNVQVRLVRRDHFLETIADMEGEDRDGWFFEVHNLYVDLYSPAGPVGLFNVRAGHFYVPMGINLQTDTHGTLLQLSNHRNFGFERDWYAGFWGSLNEHLNYDAYYLLGSGSGVRFHGQGGMAGVRFSLADAYRVHHGLEGGLAGMYGERLVHGDAVATARAGGDLRYTQPLGWGSLVFTAELTAGRDEDEAVLTQLYQLDFLADRRRWGLSAQYRRFHQDFDVAHMEETDASLVGEAAWYFRNDPANASIHSLRLNVERRFQGQMGDEETVWTFQYYFYW